MGSGVACDVENHKLSRGNTPQALTSYGGNVGLIRSTHAWTAEGNGGTFNTGMP